MTDGNICVFKNAVTAHNKYTPEMIDRLWSLTTREKPSCQNIQTEYEKEIGPSVFTDTVKKKIQFFLGERTLTHNLLKM